MPVTASTTYGMFVLDADQLDHARRIPLTGVEVRARITGPTSRVQLRQSYRNESETPVEATYVFPLEEGSAVCGFRVTIDGANLEGRVEAREKAFDRYDDALAEAKTAFLLDQERADIFVASVGNLLPRQELTVELEYVAEVPREGDALRWRLPTTVSPRYVPQDRNAQQMDSAERISGPVTDAPLPYHLQLQVVADLGTPLQSVESPSHKTRVRIDGTCARIELAGDEGPMDRDFVLLLHPRGALAPVSCIQPGPGGGRYVGVSFLPSYEHQRDPVEVVFVVDCSGSMMGDSIEQARKTLRQCLRSLEKGDHFNVIRFGSRHETYKKRSVAYDDKSLNEADAWIRKMGADLGGTEMLQPMAAAYQLPAIEGVRRRIVLITDGQVANEDEVIRLVQRHASGAKVFAFGVGYGASEHLVKGAARAGRGAAEMVYPGESIDDKVLRHFHRMTARELEDVRLNWEGLEVEDVLPHEMPPVWAGEPLSFYGKVKEGESGRAVLSLRVRGEQQRFVAEVEVAPEAGLTSESADAVDRNDAPAGPAMGTDAARRAAVPTLWARRRIRELEESPGWTGRYGSQQAGRKAKKSRTQHEQIEAQLVELGEQFGLVSAATSYVLIHEREGAERAETRATYVRVPGQLTRGWHGHFRGLQHSVLSASAPLTRRSFGALLGSAPQGMSPEAAVEDFAPLGLNADEIRASSNIERAAKPAPIDELAMQITADGYWAHSPEVFKVTLLTKQRSREIAADLDVSRAAELVATLAVIVGVKRHFLEIPAQWKPLLQKARKWVKRTVAGAKPPVGADWEEWMEKVLR